VVLDGFQVQVKPKSEAKAPWDFYTLVSTTPAEKAFTPLSESKCKMGTLGQ
jgi:branched-chain amino acid transport system substrate-binding protein